ncbi:hypothetical protein CCUS01_15857, partial [Colletotrichum cuscutae]
PPSLRAASLPNAPACRSVLLLGQPFVPELLRGPQLGQGCHSCGGGFAEAKHQH